ncbi:hypothetical protein ACA910_001724 [Epithemia clementina (nom. ined.)]
MVGRRQRVQDIGGGIVSQRIGQFERSRHSKRRSDSKVDSLRNANTQSSSDEDTPILQWSNDSDSPRSGHSETDSWRQFNDERQRDPNFYSAIYGDGSSSTNTEATDVRVDSFMHHLDRLLNQEERDQKSAAQKDGKIARIRSRIRHSSKKQESGPSQNDVHIKSAEEEELDKLVLESSSSGSNGASEWFKHLLEEAVSKQERSNGARKGKSERRVRWKNENQEHHFQTDDEEEEEEEEDPILGQRTPRSKRPQSWKQASAEFGSLFHDNDPDSILQNPPRQAKHPSRDPSAARNSDWDFNQQIFPSSSSSLEAKLPTSPASHTDYVTTAHTSNDFPVETDHSMQSRSSPESLHKHMSKISGKRSPVPRKVHDPPAATSDSMYVEEPFDSTSILLRRVNLEPTISSPSQVDPDGVLLDTNPPPDVSDDSAIHNQVLSSRAMNYSEDTRPFNEEDLPDWEKSLTNLRRRYGEEHKPDWEKLQRSRARHQFEGGDKPDWGKAPRSTWIPVSAPVVISRRDRSFHYDTTQDESKKMRLQSLKESLDEKNRLYGSRSARDDDDESSLFSDLLSAADQSHRSASSPAIGRVAARGYLYPQETTEERKRNSPSAKSPISSSSRSRRSHKVTFAESTDPKVSLLDEASSSESECEGATTSVSRPGNIAEQLLVREKQRPRGGPIPITTASAPVDEDQTFTPVANNRTAEGISSFSEDRLPRIPQLEQKRHMNKASGKPKGPPHASQHSGFEIQSSIYTVDRAADPASDDRDARFRSLMDTEPSASQSPRDAVPVGDSGSLNSETRNSPNTLHHPPFTSVRDTVASPHDTSVKEDCRTSTAISVGEERDGHRSFTSVRETVASATHKFYESAADLISPSSLDGGRLRRPNEKSGQSEQKTAPSDSKGYGNVKSSNIPAAAEKTQTKSNGHKRDYWKSIRALKTLGSFDSLSAINDPHRKARKSQEFVDRDESLRRAPLQTKAEPLVQRIDERLASDQLVANTFLGERNNENPFHHQNKEDVEKSYEPTPTHANMGLTSPPRIQSSRSELESMMQRSRSRGWSREESIASQQHQTTMSHEDEPYRSSRINSLRPTRTRSPRRVASDFDGDSDRVRSRSSQSFASPTLLSGDSEDSGSTADDQTVSILDGETTVEPTACCTFTVGDLRWGLEWLRFRRN